KARTIGGATLDTILAYEEMFTMNLQKKDTLQSFMLLEEWAKIEVTDQKSFSCGVATNAAVSFKKNDIDVSFFGNFG
ncbi:carbohydrate kinase family protein, partial [Francisella tularensis subsp. holarctica]|nr:carbohydrate kinase family protein [Francisella tularensis subsp. holarctica]